MRLLPLILLAAACANPEETDPERDGGIARDAGVRDSGVRDAGDAERDAGEVDRDGGEVDRDGGEPARDGGPGRDGGPRVIQIEVAYAATVEAPLLADLYLTESSTTRAKVTPMLAGGPTMDSKGFPQVTGVDNFGWTNDGQGLIYAAQQDTFDVYELYLAPQPGVMPAERLSIPNGGSQVRFWDQSAATDWIVFAQALPGDFRAYNHAVRALRGQTPVQISFGSSGVTTFSPTAAEVVFQDIIVSASDRDLWHVNLAVSPPTRTRVNPGANLGYGNVVSWAADGSQFVYNADENALRLFELWRAPVTGGMLGAREMVTAALPPNADVIGTGNAQFAPSGTMLAYLADIDVDQVEDLYVVDLSGMLPATPTKLSLPFPMGAEGVDRFAWSADGSRILYAADHDTAGQLDLYITSINAPSGVRVNTPVGPNESVEHEQFVRNDSMVIYTRWDGSARSVFAVDVSTAMPGTPAPLGPIVPFFPTPQYELSRSEDFMIHSTADRPPRLYVSDLTTATPTTSVVLEAFDSKFSFAEERWCWGPNDQLLIVGVDGHLHLVEDLTSTDLFRISGPLAQDGRVTRCKFRP